MPRLCIVLLDTARVPQQHPRALPAPTKMLCSPQANAALENGWLAALTRANVSRRWDASHRYCAEHTQCITDGLSHRKRYVTGLQYASASRAQIEKRHVHVDDRSAAYVNVTLSVLLNITVYRIPTQSSFRPRLFPFLCWIRCWLALTGCSSDFQKCQAPPSTVQETGPTRAKMGPESGPTSRFAFQRRWSQYGDRQGSDLRTVS